MKRYLLITLLLAWSHQAFSADIDLYVNNTASSVQRPSVLVILDTSSSMLNIATSGTNAHTARKIIIDLINDNPKVDFALQIFNQNDDSSNNGGRIIFGFQDLSLKTDRDRLILTLDTDLDNTNNNYKKLNNNRFWSNGGLRGPDYTWTPLCETLYETYRYLSGGQVYYGAQGGAFGGPASIKSSGNYDSPFADITCNKEITIIYITDGEPRKDKNADSKVRALTGTDDTNALSVAPDGLNYLGVLGRWMATRNWNTTEPFTAIADTAESAIVASVKIHTVGFGSITSNADTVNLLKLAARDGVVAQSSTGKHDRPAGGEYHAASTAAALKESLKGIVDEVLDSSTLTSASVSGNSSDRTQTSDSVFYGMFEPSTAARWQGNVKKYKIVNGVQVDVLGNPAVNSAGEFDKDSKSFWSTAVDGNEVAEGGVAEMLRATATNSRKFVTDIGITSGVLPTLTLATVATTATGISSGYTTGDMITEFDIPFSEKDDIPNHLKWAMGVDVDDEDITSLIRPDVFGDPLHSKPIVVNYATGGTRIVVGTNAGVLHMFKDVSDTEVKESWAYLPKELFKNIKPLRENVIAVDNKIYGLDGEITLYINESDGNGRVDAGDTAWLFFGLRRGGTSYYALDITSPDAPKLMWHIKNTGDFDKLGLTFSKPQVVKSALNKTVGDTDKLVVIFGGGYDIEKDNSGPNTHNDDLGAAVYMVNAKTGAKIFKKPTGAKNGIASSIASLDSDSDGLVDRLYVGDTGGNVWRVDMPDADDDHSSIIKLASLGGSTDADDIRFFNQPDIVRTYILETTKVGTNIVKHEVPYDAILLGSGDRATPTNTDTNDMFFMIKDKYIKTQQFGSAPATAVPTAITLSKLYDYTDDPFKGYPVLTSTQEGYLEDVSKLSGWYFDLEQPGEKNSAQAIVINNVVYFTSYSPSPDASCSVNPGDAWLYAVDLALGIKKYNWGTDTDNRGGDDRIKRIGNQFPGAPTLISTPVTTTIINEDGTTTTTTDTQGNLIVGKAVLPVGFTLQTMRTSLTIPEN